MQRLLVILTVILLVAASLGVGTLAANWPFWRRAWQWHEAAGGPNRDWPVALPGPRQRLQGGSGARPLQFEPDPALAAVAATGRTELLLRATGEGQAGGWFAPGFTADTPVDGRGLATVALVPLFAILAAQRPGLLDAPIGAWIEEWREDRRGPITPRQLFWQLSGLPAGRFHPLNPFSSSAQLASGPDFTRAVLRWGVVWPPGSHFEESPANAQLLALVASRLAGEDYADLLQRRIWSRIAAADAWLMLDHRRGAAAAHCCLRASAADWLRLALLLATDGAQRDGALWSPGFLAEMTRASPVHADYGLGFRLLRASDSEIVLAIDSPGRQLLIAPATQSALLWTGAGEPPAGLAELLRRL
jgi:hypothetical protein